MSERSQAPRFLRLPLVTVFGRRVPVAATRRTRLLGLSGLDRDEAGPGLLIPRCASIHTFRMRFPLDLFFLDRDGAVLDRRWDLAPSRVVYCRGAASVLELPAQPFEISSG